MMQPTDDARKRSGAIERWNVSSTPGVIGCESLPTPTHHALHGCGLDPLKRTQNQPFCDLLSKQNMRANLGESSPIGRFPTMANDLGT